MLFCDKPSTPALAIAVTVPPPDIVLIALLETELAPARLVDIAVSGDVPPVQLLNVLPDIVCAPVPESVTTQPATVVAPVTVMFEKLLLLCVNTAPDAEGCVVLVNNVTVLVVAADFVNAVTILLLLTFWKPVAETGTLSLMKTKFASRFTLRLVNVFPVMVCDNVVAELTIIVCAPVGAVP